jgi:hypothetical protein
MVEPWVLQIERVRAPSSLACLTAIRVSIGLAGLADGDHEGALVDDRVAVAELVGERDLDRDPGPVLDGVLRDHPRVRGGATGDDDDAVDLPELLLGDAQLVEDEAPSSSVRPSRVSATACGCS